MPAGYSKGGKTKHFPYTAAGKKAAKASMKYKKKKASNMKRRRSSH